jgi:hypothetical protein
VDIFTWWPILLIFFKLLLHHLHTSSTLLTRYTLCTLRYVSCTLRYAVIMIMCVCVGGGGGSLQCLQRAFRLCFNFTQLFTVLRPAQEFFAYMETSPLSVKGCKILAFARCSGPLIREGSLSWHTCCDKVPRFFLSHPKNRPIYSPLKTR